MAAKNTSKKIKRPKPPKSSKKTSAADAELDSARSSIKKLKATVRQLEKKVAKAQKKADGFKTELKKLRKPKKSVEAIVEHDEPASAPDPAPVPEPEPEPESESESAGEVAPVSEAPASELTVAQLRAAAREQGVPGYSSMRKEQLIAALS